MFVFPMPAFKPEEIHPILVNFTAALVPASVGSDIAGRVLRKASLHAAAWWMLVYAAAITPLTGLAGMWWKSKVGDMLSPELILRHERLGFSLVGGLLVLAAWRYTAYRKSEAPGLAYLLLGLVVVLGLVLQGSLGGAMLFGGVSFMISQITSATAIPTRVCFNTPTLCSTKRTLLLHPIPPPIQVGSWSKPHSLSGSGITRPITLYVVPSRTAISRC